jgi:hypothetical protein
VNTSLVFAYRRDGSIALDEEPQAASGLYVVVR